MAKYASFILFGLFLLALHADIASAKALPKDAPLDNNPGMRSFSDRLDSAFKWGGYDEPNQSKVRATLHAGYHEFQHLRTGNQREHERAKDQWGVVTGGRTDNLQRYDAGRN